MIKNFGRAVRSARYGQITAPSAVTRNDAEKIKIEFASLIDK